MVTDENLAGGKHFHLRRHLALMARGVAELPVVRQVSSPLYRNYFRKPCRRGNLYFGVYKTYEDALEQAHQLSSMQLPSTYDVDGATTKYLDQIESLRPCDYPAMFWIDRILRDSGRRVFDLGGHLGVAYYSYRRYLSYPADLVWRVHDLPRVMAAGKSLARELDPAGSLQFCETPTGGDGFDLLISSGALQYLDYRLPDLIDRLDRPPRHVLFNLTPLHAEKSFFTLQNLGIAICPYRVESQVRLIEDMQARGYTLRDHWRLGERNLRIPFEPGYEVGSYHGCYFERTASFTA
ncbi:MAG TPA: methyltransferase, TIGR04325 family [Dyella sp.]|uniref:methyltransferase, TIGR04325 family n=1 Tax=Dyella sp. TaxID=1869338 RepID=UPI002D77118B|nr:methyltransferase, TIGR04325 family [Dyella sp.]HET6554442.1 methyltransferase, TIGR04325 family [Dyella sp.]